MTNDKKVALVTGANRGIGLETARQLGQNGITVVVAARSLKAAKETAATLQGEGIDAFPVQLDVTKEDDRKSAAKVVAEKYGKLDILINNAGVGAEDGMFASEDSGDDRSGTAEGFWYKSFLRNCRDQGVSAASQEKFRRTHRQPLQHPGVTDLACRPEQSNREH